MEPGCAWGRGSLDGVHFSLLCPTVGQCGRGASGAGLAMRPRLLPATGSDTRGRAVSADMTVSLSAVR